MNKPLLRKIKRRILAHPEEFDMGLWHTRVPCGTTACIAGWACLLNGDQPCWGGVDGRDRCIDPDESYHVEDGDGNVFKTERRAQELLGLTEEQADALFYVSEWPGEEGIRFWSIEDPKERATVAAERIDHFIETGK